MTRKELFNTLGLYRNYIIMALASLVFVCFVPFLGTEIGLAFVLPTTVAGWCVYVITKLAAAALNVLIFHCFVSQGKLNVREHPNVIAANEILAVCEKKDTKLLSPRQFLAREYGVKGITVFVTTVLSAVSLSQAILTFDLAAMLTYLFMIVGGTIAGWLEMGVVEEFWVFDYYEYAKEQERLAEEARANLQAETVTSVVSSAEELDSLPASGTPVLESPSCNGNTELI